jgi:hypothetical protein
VEPHAGPGAATPLRARRDGAPALPTAARCNGDPSNSTCCSMQNSHGLVANSGPVGSAVCRAGAVKVHKHWRGCQGAFDTGSELFKSGAMASLTSSTVANRWWRNRIRDPALHHLHGGLDLAFVLRVVGAVRAGTRCRSGAQGRAPSLARGLYRSGIGYQGFWLSGTMVGGLAARSHSR